MSKRPLDKKQLKAKITRALNSAIPNRQTEISALIPESFTAGKLYEAYILGRICQKLKSLEGCTLQLMDGQGSKAKKQVVLKTSGGPINTYYPHIQVQKNGQPFADIWTDVEFIALSSTQMSKVLLTLGDMHEMDIIVVLPGTTSYPNADNIMLAAECKNTGYEKNLLREILGVRRELSFRNGIQHPTHFSAWPRQVVPADPPSCVSVYSTDSDILKYSAPGIFWGIDFYHEPF